MSNPNSVVTTRYRSPPVRLGEGGMKKGPKVNTKTALHADPTTTCIRWRVCGSVATAGSVAVLCGDNRTDRGTRMAALTAAGYRMFAISGHNQHIA